MNRYGGGWLCLLVGACLMPLKASAWEATRADLEEAFLLWATPRVQFSPASQEDAHDLLMKDTEEAALVLPKFFASPNGSIRDKILTLTEQLGAQAVGPAFRPHAGSDSPNLAMAMFCLSRAHDTESLPILLKHLRHANRSMRSVAALSLGYLRSPDALPDLVQILAAETEPSVRKSIAFAIGQCADSATVTGECLDALIHLLGDDFFATRFNAGRSLAALADPAARRISAAYDALSDTARYHALFAAGRMQDEVSFKLLETAAADTSAPLVLRGIALKGLLDRKASLSDTDLPDLRGSAVGRGLFGLIR